MRRSEVRYLSANFDNAELLGLGESAHDIAGVVAHCTVHPVVERYRDVDISFQN